MDYETFSTCIKSLTEALDRRLTNTVVFINKPKNVVMAAIAMPPANQMFDNQRTEFKDSDAMTSEEIHQLVFDKTNDPKLIILYGVKPLLENRQVINAVLRMTYMTLPEPVALVVLREYERGWGSKDFDAQPFYDRAAAEARVKEVNSKNDQASAPDYYIVADLITKTETFGGYERIY